MLTIADFLSNGRRPFRPDAEKISVGRDRLYRPDLQDRRRRRQGKATVALARKLAVVPHKMLRDQTDFAAHQAKPMMAA